MWFIQKLSRKINNMRNLTNDFDISEIIFSEDILFLMRKICNRHMFVRMKLVLNSNPRTIVLLPNYFNRCLSYDENKISIKVNSMVKKPDKCEERREKGKKGKLKRLLSITAL